MVKKRRKQKRRKNPQKNSLTKKIKRGIFRLFDFTREQISFLPGKIKRQVLFSLTILLAITSFLSLFEKAGTGRGGEALRKFLFEWIGNSTYLIPLLLLISGFSFLIVSKKLFFVKIFGVLVFILGASGVLEILNLFGGKIGVFLANPLRELFGNLVSFFVFLTLILIWGFISWHIFFTYFSSEKSEETFVSQVIKRMRGLPKFKILEIEPKEKIPLEKEVLKPEILKPKKPELIKFFPPPFELLEKEVQRPGAGDIRENTFLIKKTLENFGIEVSMTEVNVGPTVTQYTLKPAEGVKLSKITALSNNLALVLASHPIRIEAPIPGRPLVGVEVPNKLRSRVRLRDFIAHPDFQKSVSNLTFVLGRDVAGNPVFGDLARLPHLLVAGSTGTGKTIFLNSLILSLLYQNSPKTLRFILVDPKRVEFPVYNDLAHLLCPVIFDPQRTINALKWLVEEMERRFEILSEFKVKDISSFNEMASKREMEPLPYIILIIDELADLMAARGKEMEAGIVRIAQMARAVGIHLVIATQRPSVEILTGLIKANITSRVAFQVATQIDSRTILDMAGAEKLLGLGDMLYICAETVKPKRIQGAYVSEKEVKRVVGWIKEKAIPEENELFREFEEFEERAILEPESIQIFEDPLYEEAKRIVIRHQRASASLLQRRLQIGYARAARLLDMLEQKGIVGPPRGAKPRKVYPVRDSETE